MAAFSAVTAVVLSPLAVAASPAFADSRDNAQIHLVSPATAAAENWSAQAYENSSAGAYTNPDQSVDLTAGAPLGQGARFFHMGQYSVQVELYRTTALDGATVGDITRLDYSTWAEATGSLQGEARSPKQPPYLRLSISSDGSGPKDTTLNFEPAENGAQGAVAQSRWQDWQTAATGGRWHVIEAGGPNTTVGSYVSLADYAAANPDATLADNTNGGALSIVAGDAGANQTYARLGFDRVGAEVGSQSYLWDLEPDAGTTSGTTQIVKSVSATGVWNTSARNLSGNSGNGSATDVRQAFEVGPKIPPAGKGSLVMSIGDNSDATQYLRSTVLDGKPVSDLRKLGYSAYAEKVAGTDAGANLQQPPYLRLSISSDGSGTKDTTLNFEPANNPEQHALEAAKWQAWNAFDGKFRVVEAPGVTETPDSYLTLAAYMTRHPQATFVPNEKTWGGKGALSFVIGAAGDNQRNGRFAVDNITVGTSATVAGKPGVSATTYDLEPTYTVPTVNGTSRKGAGPVTLTGTAGSGDKVEVRILGAVSDTTTVAATVTDWNTVAGTATADSNGKWSFQLPMVSARTSVRAYLAGTYGGVDIHSATADVQVSFNVPITATTSRGYTYGGVRLDPAVGGVTIVWEQYVNRQWVKITESKTVSSGAANLKWNTTAGKTYVLRARALSTSTVLGGTSATKTVKSS